MSGPTNSQNERTPLYAWLKEPHGVLLALVFVLFPVAEHSVFGWPLYWAETALLLSFGLVLWRGATRWPSLRAVLLAERRFFFFAALLIMGVMIATFLNPHTLSSWGNVKSFYGVPVLFSLLILLYGKTRGQLSFLIAAWLIGITLAALAAILAASQGWLLYDGRLAGPYSSANYLAMLVAPGVLLSLFCIRDQQSMLQRWFVLPALVLILVTLWWTHSYAAWIALGASLGVMLVLGRSTAWRSSLLVLLAGLLVIGFFFQDRGTEKWQNLISLDERSSLASRLMIWRSATQIAIEASPIGIGSGRFQELYLTYQPQFPPYLEWAVPTPHNLYLHFWLEGGVLALFGWFGMLAVLFRRIQAPWKTVSGSAAALQSLTAALLVLYLVYGLIDTPYMKNDLVLAVWGTCGLLLAVTRLKETSETVCEKP